jgi:hypothetical protein
VVVDARDALAQQPILAGLLQSERFHRRDALAAAAGALEVEAL